MYIRMFHWKVEHPFVRSTPSDILHNWTCRMQSTMGSYDEPHSHVATSYLLGMHVWGLTAHPQQGGWRTSKRRTTKCYSRGGDAPGIDSTVGTPATRTRCSRRYCTATHWKFQPFLQPQSGLRVGASAYLNSYSFPRQWTVSRWHVVGPHRCTCELELHDCISPSRTPKTEPSAIIPDSVQISRKPASWNRLPIMDRRLKILWKVPSLRRTSA